MNIERIGDECYDLGECPIWDPQDRVLYFVDCPACAMFRYNPRNGDIKRWDVDCGYLGSFALRTGGGAILVMDDGFHTFDFETGKVTAIVEPEAGRTNLCFNDCKVDRQGRLIAGSMHTDLTEPVANLYRLDTDLTCTKIDDGYICSNGPCWSPDGGTLYVSDSNADAIFAYDYDTVSGNATNRRTFLSTADSGGLPDGGTVDAEGHIWSAHFESGTIRRITPAGIIERVIELPVQWVASLTFGGDDHDIIYFTSMGCEFEGDRDSSPQAGGLFAIHGLGIQGLVEPRFAG
ncbi:MAG: SMP-30/gluconolactonase/LRE family protein [Desulfobacterales bacterium]|nr:SMP-30/gluconolactonase/LRE family protein [Desulfobacterales bacterium]